MELKPSMKITRLEKFFMLICFKNILISLLIPKKIKTNIFEKGLTQGLISLGLEWLSLPTYEYKYTFFKYICLFKSHSMFNYAW